MTIHLDGKQNPHPGKKRRNQENPEPIRLRTLPEEIREPGHQVPRCRGTL